MLPADGSQIRSPSTFGHHDKRMKTLRIFALLLTLAGILIVVVYGRATHDMFRLGAEEIWTIPANMTDLRDHFPYLWLATTLSRIDPYAAAKVRGAIPPATIWRNQFTNNRNIGFGMIGVGLLFYAIHMYSRSRTRTESPNKGLVRTGDPRTARQSAQP